MKNTIPLKTFRANPRIPRGMQPVHRGKGNAFHHAQHSQVNQQRHAKQQSHPDEVNRFHCRPDPGMIVRYIPPSASSHPASAGGTPPGNTNFRVGDVASHVCRFEYGGC